jgi:hypothetical protein
VSLTFNSNERSSLIDVILQQAYLIDEETNNVLFIHSFNEILIKIGATHLFGLPELLTVEKIHCQFKNKEISNVSTTSVFVSFCINNIHLMIEHINTHCFYPMMIIEREKKPYVYVNQ